MRHMTADGAQRIDPLPTVQGRQIESVEDGRQLGPDWRLHHPALEHTSTLERRYDETHPHQHECQRSPG